MDSADTTKEFLGSEAGATVSVIHRVTSSSRSGYGVTSVESHLDLMDQDLATANRVLWNELLNRAHLAATSSLLRIERWMDAAMNQAREGNLLGFAACLRGMIEAASDTAYSLGPVPMALAEHSAAIQLAIDGKISGGVFDGGELETALLHYQFAHKTTKAEADEPSWTAKPAAEYFKVLDWDGKGEIQKLYRTLSGLAHPSAHSLGTLPQSYFVGLISEEDERKAIREICDDQNAPIVRALISGSNIALLILKVLNEFTRPEVHTKAMESIDLAGVPAWKNIRVAARSSKQSPILRVLGIDSS